MLAAAILNVNILSANEKDWESVTKVTTGQTYHRRRISVFKMADEQDEFGQNELE